MRCYYIAINNSKPELADPDVRRALAKLVDVPKLIEILEGGLGRQSASAFNEKKPYYNDDLTLIQYDIEGARKILSEKGWADTNQDGSVDKIINGKAVEMDLDIYITGSPLSKNIALLLQQSAKEVGITINIITKKFAQISSEHIAKRDYDLTPLVLGQDLFLDDPYSTWHSDNDAPNKGNLAAYRSEKTDEIIDNIITTKDESERVNLYKELQQVMYDDQPVIFLYNPKEKLILSKKWKGSTTLKRPGYFAGEFTGR